MSLAVRVGDSERRAGHFRDLELIADAWEAHWPAGSRVMAIDDFGQAFEAETSGEGVIAAGRCEIALRGHPGMWDVQRIVPIRRQVQDD